MIRHATQTPPALTRLNREVPDELARIVGMMMAPSPRQRYQTPERAAADLSAFLVNATAPPSQEPEPTTVHPPPPVIAPTLSLPSRVPPPEAPSIPSPPLLPWPEGSFLRERVEKPHAETEPVSIDVKSIAGLREAEGPSAPVRWRPNRRDFIFLLLGAVGLLLAEMIGWLLARLVSGRRGNPSGR